MALTLNNHLQHYLQQGKQFAIDRGHAQLLPEHILLVMLTHEDSFICTALKNQHIKSAPIIELLQESIAYLPEEELPKTEDSKALTEVLKTAVIYQKNHTLPLLGEAHFALLLCEDRIARIFSIFGLTRDHLENEIETWQNKSSTTAAEDLYPTLQQYAVSLNQEAVLGHFDPVIGREEEISRLIQILSRRRKNNPILLGQPGVGKTAIIEGFVQRIITRHVPIALQNKQLYSLTISAILASVSSTNEFESRMQKILDEVQLSDGRIILFIDEIHTIMGINGTPNLANMLKPMLARGTLRIIGATTFDEYRQYLEKDGALERRFQSIVVNEPSIEETRLILDGIKHRYEIYHGVEFTPTALDRVAELAARYIAYRQMPDKAVDILDEAAAIVRIQAGTYPESLNIINQEIQEIILKHQNLVNAPSKQEIHRSLLEREQKKRDILSQWTQETELIQCIKLHKEKRESLMIELQIQGDNPEQVQRLITLQKEITTVELEIKHYRTQLINIQRSTTLAKYWVEEKDVALAVSKISKVPMNKMLEEETEKLIHMETHLQNRVIGQEEAIHAVSNAVRRSRLGYSNSNKPTGSFIFLGTTGVGKTELAKALAEFLFDDEKALIRIDMSEYMEKHAVARLIGAPPGYTGYDQGGYLTEAVRHRPYSVILFDEIEKAHLDVFNIFLQILDDGRLTDSMGKTVDFTNTLIVMTSNIGAAAIYETQDKIKLRNIITAELRKFFRPEFLNRIDDTLIFNTISFAMTQKIVNIKLNSIQKTILTSEHPVEIQCTPAAIRFFAEHGYDPIFGGRPLIRVIQKSLLDGLTLFLLDGKCQIGDIVQVDHQHSDQLTFSVIGTSDIIEIEEANQHRATPTISKRAKPAKLSQSKGVGYATTRN